MQSAIFLQSEVHNPYKLYAGMLLESPVYWDDANKVWAIYSYKNCKAILHNPSAQIPPIKHAGLNEYALAIISRLARLSNEPHHEIARQVATRLFQNMKPTSINDMLCMLFEKESNLNEIDWVGSVCKKLPVLSILKSFEFDNDDTNFILNKISQLVKIMQPEKDHEQIVAVNEISKEVYCRIERHILRTVFLKELLNDLVSINKFKSEEILALCVSNLAGFLIQSFDAARGILSNSLLHFLLHEDLTSPQITDRIYLQKSITEILRFYPPVHNTRRFAAEDIFLDDCKIEKGQGISIVLAAANRDLLQFENAGQYNIERSNNDEHLTFGLGCHMCLAKHFSIKLATDVLLSIFQKYKAVNLLSKDIEYEPMINVRLPKYILISFS